MPVAEPTVCSLVSNLVQIALTPIVLGEQTKSHWGTSYAKFFQKEKKFYRHLQPWSSAYKLTLSVIERCLVQPRWKKEFRQKKICLSFFYSLADN